MKPREPLTPPPEYDDIVPLGVQLPDWATCVCVVGVGYVGESLLGQFSNVFDCIGFDISQDRIAALTSRLKVSSRVQLTNNEASLARATHFFIAVPTPLRSDNSIELCHIHSAIDTVLKYAKEGSCIVIESSVPVGATRKLLGPYQDRFNCGMSPERIDPGRTYPSAGSIPKLVSGLTDRALRQIVDLYSRVYESVIPVSTPEVAEMTKLYENCYRMVNIAFVNEMSDAAESHGINPQEMIAAASTKPFGFQPFYPGLGVGGHCIPVNPYYLFINNKLPILENATRLMVSRPRKKAGTFHSRCLKKMMAKNLTNTNTLPRMLIVGIGFKPNQSDVSQSPSLRFAERLRQLGCSKLAYFDPLVDAERVTWMEKLPLTSWNSSHIAAKFDGVAICNSQQNIDLTCLDKLPESLQVTSFINGRGSIRPL